MQLCNLFNFFYAEINLKFFFINDLIFFFKDVMLNSLFFAFIS